MMNFCIVSFESYSLGVFIIRDLCENFMRFFFPWTTFAMYFEYREFI